MTDRSLLVYVDIEEKPVLVGRLWARERRGRETASFAYDETWLRSPERFALEPALTLSAGDHHTPANKALFGALGDSAPDRWGRNLMRRAERQRARREGRAPHTLLEIDYLLGVDDETRMGALRFAEEAGGPFLASGGPMRVPPLIELPRLLSATERLADDDDGNDDDLRLLLAPGSSLGGARPKASIRDRDGTLAIAKFPHKEDDFPIVLWEAVSLRLAARAGIPVPDARIEPVADKAVLILRRFDRAGSRRVPFLSAMSMIGASDNEAHSYLEIADALSQCGAAPTEDLAALWRRVLFNILISNTDDHLRNHGFLYDRSGGWRLSPAYDLNPVPTDIKARLLSLAIDEEDTTASFELAMETAPYYRLTNERARTVAREVAAAVTDWREEAARAGLTSNQIGRMSSAFDQDDLRKAGA
ncbi:MAG TPA: HipA domain-containing protein [Stellaceae bacterium]|nr:HipA domain-containing protein [Stellaceae bacterium]